MKKLLAFLSNEFMVCMKINANNYELYFDGTGAIPMN